MYYDLGKLLFIIPLFFVIIIWRFYRIKTLKKIYKITIKREITVLLFMLYMVFLASVTIVNFNFVHDLHGVFGFFTKINLIPFKQIFEAYDIAKTMPGYDFSYFLLNIGGNIALFIPFGFMIPLLWNITIRKTILYGFLASCSIEILQLPFIRGTDIDDVLLNTVGIVVGCLIYYVIRKKEFCCNFRIHKQTKLS